MDVEAFYIRVFNMKVNTVLIVFVMIALVAPFVYLFRNIRTENHHLEDEILWI